MKQWNVLKWHGPDHRGSECSDWKLIQPGLIYGWD